MTDIIVGVTNGEDAADSINQAFSQIQENTDNIITDLLFRSDYGLKIVSGTEIETAGNLICRDDTDTFTIELPNGWTKSFRSTFAIGDGNGAFAGTTASFGKLYNIFAIAKADGTSDIMTSVYGVTPTFPAGFVYKRLIARLQVDMRGRAGILYNYKDFYHEAKNNQLPYNYKSDFQISKLSSASVKFTNITCKDDTGTFDLRYKDYNNAEIGKKFDANFSEGELGGMLDTGTLADNTLYYIFIIYDTKYGTIDFLMSLSQTAPTMPTNYALKRLIGFLYTEDYSSDVTHHIVWSINDKWVDENFDTGTVTKDNVNFPFVPEFEDLFGTGIYVATFDSSGSQDHYIPAKEETDHGIKPKSAIWFHGHLVPETATEGNTEGNVVMFVDAVLTKDGDDPPTSASVVSKKLIIEMNGKAQEFDFPLIYPADFGKSEFGPGYQLCFNMGRKSTSINDTYLSKIATQTMGFHYIQYQAGSDILAENIL